MRGRVGSGRREKKEESWATERKRAEQEKRANDLLWLREREEKGDRLREMRWAGRDSWAERKR
jgi:hypothetical protein